MEATAPIAERGGGGGLGLGGVGRVGEWVEGG